ncbi:lytic transglycosylase domain-containing protein [Luteimonas sp. MHLX1A]|uniref:lytic transglycosylase domain-containing protein n=1 Tax=Alterluteimonas muca TaxID=2878684 RepID=UPI001E37B687|nr:lytic transglycosylase domain-containing protein [Luteimonas sp. MHLX1A]MCD9046732.1 lytic transglycosylase domain-containing protein [Luteimonas sp. MHLX1A]
MPTITSSASSFVPQRMDLPPEFTGDVVACIATAANHYSVDPQLVLDRLLARNSAKSAASAIGRFSLSLAELEDAGISSTVRQAISTDDCLGASIAVLVEAKALRESSAGAASTQPSHGGSPLMTVAVSPGPRQGPRLPRLDARGEACVDAAAGAYQLPNAIFRAVLRTEGGWQGLRKRNSNGSYDLGPGQINTIHLPELRKFGISEQMLADDVCLNVHVAAYRLRVEIERVKDVWRGVGNYHSRTPHLHNAYLARVRSHL